MTIGWWIFLIAFNLLLFFLCYLYVKSSIKEIRKIVQENELYENFGTKDVDTIKRVFGVKDYASYSNSIKIYSMSLEDLGLK